MSLCDDLQFQIMVYLGSQNKIKILKSTTFTLKRYALNLPIGTSCIFKRDYLSDRDLKYLKDVHTITLSHENHVTDKGLHNLKNAHSVILYNCDKITNHGIRHLKNIYCINIIMCPKVDDSAYKYFANKKNKFIKCHPRYNKEFQGPADSGYIQQKIIQQLEKKIDFFYV